MCSIINDEQEPTPVGLLGVSIGERGAEAIPLDLNLKAEERDQPGPRVSQKDLLARQIG
jgi:hypothetical protein